MNTSYLEDLNCMPLFAAWPVRVRKLRSLILPTFASAIPYVAGAQAPSTASFSLVGRVVSNNGTPLTAVNISAGDADSMASKFARTDANGAFRIVFHRGSTTIAVVARLLGYAAQTRRVTVAPNDALLEKLKSNLQGL